MKINLEKVDSEYEANRKLEQPQPGFYSHTDLKKASKRLQGGTRQKRLFDGAVREIDYVNQTTRGFESHDLNKQSKELKFNLSKSNILGSHTLNNYPLHDEITEAEDVSMI